MALSGHKDPDLQVIQIGSTKEQVDQQLGLPKESHPTNYGARTDIYEYETNNEPSAARAVTYFLYDAITLCFAEIVFTPAELATGIKTRVPIYYGADGLVAGVNETAPEAAP
ncbi:MAG TPA: hypothetical protein VJ746_03130 [Nitrospira sp.]|nr:hypothetical protein [Nitrospira sp.]